jgi:hypothetical protein
VSAKIGPIPVVISLVEDPKLKGTVEKTRHGDDGGLLMFLFCDTDQYAGTRVKDVHKGSQDQVALIFITHEPNLVV